MTAWYTGQEAGIPSSHLHRLIITDDVLIQFNLLMMSTVMLEKYRDENSLLTGIPNSHLHRLIIPDYILI